jgi:hypothetical protein
VAVAIGGCQTSQVSVPPPDTVSIPQTTSSALAELTRFGNAVRELDSRQLEQQYRELALRNDAFLSSDAVIKLSLLLSAPNAPFHDIDQATRFLRDVMHRGLTAPPEHTDFAELLYNLLSERVYTESDDEAMQVLLTQARDTNEQLSQELAEARAALATERERTETLQGQPNALKELEEQLSLEDVGR